MAKKKNKLVIRPWCWYCEREFEDEKVLMQHQKAKHYKCRHCPRKLNTAGGLAVHIQQVHKLDPEKIENALPGRDGGEVEIFGMEGIPKSDVEAWRRRKEAEAGIAAGSLSQPQAKRPKLDKRPLSDAELAAQLAAHKALMSGSDASSTNPSSSGPQTTGAPTVYGAPQTYAAPPAPLAAPGIPPQGPFPNGPPPPFPGAPPFLGVPPPGALPPGIPPPGFPPFPPGMPPPPGGFPPGMLPPGFPPGGPPPGLRLGAPPPGALPNGASGVPLGVFTPGVPPPHLFPPGTPGSLPPPSAALASGNGTPGGTSSTVATNDAPKSVGRFVEPILPQTNPALKAGTVLVWEDANFSSAEKRAQDSKYAFADEALPVEADAESDGPTSQTRGTKRARAEDFL